MRFDADLSDARMTVVLDIRHPFAYLALGPTIGFGKHNDLQLNWLPLSAQTLRPPSIPPSSDAAEDRSIRHKRNRAQMIAREIAVYAEAQGLLVEEPYRDGPAAAIELAWLWIRAAAPGALEAFLEEAFARYWAKQLDAGSIEHAAALVAHCGFDADRFVAWAEHEGPGAAAAVSRQLAEAGIFQTPALLVADQVFYGRQHLPMVGWLLGGRRGPGPI